MKLFLSLLAGLTLVGVLPAAAPPTVREAQAFIEDAEARLLASSVDAGRADWVK